MSFNKWNVRACLFPLLSSSYRSANWMSHCSQLNLFLRLFPPPSPSIEDRFKKKLKSLFEVKGLGGFLISSCFHATFSLVSCFAPTTKRLMICACDCCRRLNTIRFYKTGIIRTWLGSARSLPLLSIPTTGECSLDWFSTPLKVHISGAQFIHQNFYSKLFCSSGSGRSSFQLFGE